MELGGNAPFLVFEDADLDAAVDGAMVAKMRNIGEACTAANRFHVHASVAEAFTAKLAERMGALKIGRGTEDGVDVGPLIDDDQRDKVAALVEDAVAKGARVLVGGERVDGAGYFYPPTVLADVPADARLLAEEIFGPVAPIATFATEEEAIAAANDTEYGLVAYVFTRDLDAPARLERSRPAWSASTRASSPTPPRPSAASSSPASAARAASRGSTSTSRRSTSRSTRTELTAL